MKYGEAKYGSFLYGIIKAFSHGIAVSILRNLRIAIGARRSPGIDIKMKRGVSVGVK